VTCSQAVTLLLTFFPVIYIRPPTWRGRHDIPCTC